MSRHSEAHSWDNLLCNTARLHSKEGDSMCKDMEETVCSGTKETVSLAEAHRARREYWGLWLEKEVGSKL